MAIAILVILITLLIGWIGIYEFPLCLSFLKHSGMMNLKIYTSYLILSFGLGGALCVLVPQEQPSFSVPEIQVMLIAIILTLFIVRSFSGTSSFIAAVLGAWAAVTYLRTASLAAFPFEEAGISLIVAPGVSFLIVLLMVREVTRFLRRSSSHLLLKAWYLRLMLIVGLLLSGMLILYNYLLVFVPLTSNLLKGEGLQYLPILLFIVIALLFNIYKLDHLPMVQSNKMADFIALTYGLSFVLLLFNFVWPFIGLSHRPILVPATLAAMAGTLALNKERSLSRLNNICVGIFVVPVLSFLIGTALFHLYGSITVLVSSVFILVTLVIMIKMFVKQFQQHRLIKNALQDEQQRRSEIHRELNRLDMNSVTSQFDILSSKMEMKKQELLNLALHIKQQHDYMETYSTKLRDISNLDNIDDMKRQLKEIIGDMQENMKFTKEMDMFYAEVDELHKGFISKLTTVCPNLTEQEKRLAIFLRLGFSSKEMASLLNISAKSVEISRYRFRKKLKMERDENLVHYIQSL
jgi:DNA-binding CsgD family transcriptional regulator